MPTAFAIWGEAVSKHLEVMNIVTYQDLLDCGKEDRCRMDFVRSAVMEHQSSARYKTAVAAEKYYKGENPAITEYEKIIYDINGKAHKDMYTANHKIKSSFFHFVVNQLKSYLLGNGVTFSEKSTKERLGKLFDQQVGKAAQYAQIAGVAFGFWNLDHLDVFKFQEFVPLYDEENGALMAGIRYWQLAADKPVRYTLYEPDGYTEYAMPDAGKMEIMIPKRTYKVNVTAARLSHEQILYGENYPSFPIVPLKNNDDCLSEIVGKQNTIDALDLCCSNMVNNVDEGNIIYWALQNCGGMTAMDAQKFIDFVKTTHVAFVDNAPDGASAEPHTIEAPYAGTQTAIDMLTKKLYEDFQAFDASAVTAGNQTATAIRASYVPLDLKADDFEEQVTTFIMGILAVAGLDDEPTYTRNQITNKTEEIQATLMLAPYVTQEYMTKKLLTIVGDADMVEDILKQQDAENLARLGSIGVNEPEEDVTDDGTA